MNVVPLTLHHLMKYVYNNRIYQIEIDPELESFLQLEKGVTSPLKTLIPTSNIEPLEIEHNNMETVSKLFGDDWGSLEFTPSFMGEYILTQKKDEKKEQPTIISTQNYEQLSQASISYNIQ